VEIPKQSSQWVSAVERGYEYAHALVKVSLYPPVVINRAGRPVTFLHIAFVQTVHFRTHSRSCYRQIPVHFSYIPVRVLCIPVRNRLTWGIDSRPKPPQPCCWESILCANTMSACDPLPHFKTLHDIYDDSSISRQRYDQEA